MTKLLDILHALCLALAAWLQGRRKRAANQTRAAIAACALYLAALLLAVDIPDPRGEITEAHRGLHRETQRIEWVEPAQTVNVDLTGFYLDLARRPAGALCSPFSVLCSPSGEAASLSRPGAGIREGAPAVSRPQFQDDPRRFDTPAPRVRDTGTPAPGQTL